MTPEARLAQPFGTLSELLALHAKRAPRRAALILKRELREAL